MLPIVSVVGHSNSGKTTLIEKLIVELKRRGRRVAVVKHTGGSFEMDRPGKDTWRFTRAGCDSVAILGPGGSAVLERHEPDYPFERILGFVGVDADLVLVEGLHDEPGPKIEVHRAELGGDLRCDPGSLLAVVTDQPLGLPCRELAPADVGAIADLIEEKVVRRASDGSMLLVNGVPVAIGSFTQRMIGNTIKGLISSLKGITGIKTISVSIRTARDEASDD